MKQGETVEAAAAIELSAAPLTLAELDACWNRPLQVRLSAGLREQIAQSRRLLERMANGAAAVYGVNTGFGSLCRQRIAPADLATLQENLIRSHAVGVGAPLEPALVRWMMLFKIKSLAAGYSGVQPAVVEALCAMLSAELLPEVPSRGSLGASGDLAPLAHLVLPMIGEGRARFGGVLRDGAAALVAAGLTRVQLQAKDGLALVNGTQFMSAHAAAVCIRGARLARLADVAATLSLEALRGSLRPFDGRLIALRPHRGAIETAANVNLLMRESEILPSHADCGKVQDPYSLRCVPQVHGACRDALRRLAEATECEINAVTDNPILIDGEAISGGNFHGEPLALALDYSAMALTEWANISERRTFLLLSGSDGLPPFLTAAGGLNSGLMIPQYTAAALVNECKVLSHPASTDSIPTSMGQEDHVSMGATSALKCYEIVERVESVLAIELLTAAQALDFRHPLKAGLGPRAAHAAIRQHVAHAERDRAYGADVQALIELVRGGAILRAVEAAVGRLA
ncbi:MAG: histidine ammonia-lyase [Phycisphaerae bacterium]